MRDSANVFGSFLSSVQGFGDASARRTIENATNSFSGLGRSANASTVNNHFDPTNSSNNNYVALTLKAISKENRCITIDLLMKLTCLSVDAILIALKNAQEGGLLAAKTLPDGSYCYEMTPNGKSVAEMLK